MKQDSIYNSRPTCNVVIVSMLIYLVEIIIIYEQVKQVALDLVYKHNCFYTNLYENDFRNSNLKYTFRKKQF